MTVRPRRRVHATLALLGLLAMLASIVAAAPAGAQAPDGVSRDPAGLTAGPALTPSGRVEGDRAPTSRLAQTDEGLLARTDAEPVAVLIKLDYDSIATYRGGVRGFAATSPSETGQPLGESEAANSGYAGFVADRESTIVADVQRAVPEARIGRSLRVVYGGVTAVLPANRVEDVLAVDGVVAVQLDAVNQPLTDSSTEFIGAPDIWDDLAGQDNAGNGVLFGGLDTGGWPEHPSFADDSNMPPAPEDNDGNPLGCDFGDDPTTDPVDVFVCNDKLVAGHVFLDTHNAINPGEDPYPDSARDGDGHGTHTATTSAGNIVEADVLGVPRGTISGVAPGAWVAIYKVCGIQGCFTSDTAAAIEQAIFDGVDVLNFSVSGGTNPFADAVELAFLDAYAAGIFVAASAGNDGPGASTANHLSPWVTAVAASTQTREFQSTLTLDGDDTPPIELTGASITDGAGPSPVVLAADVPGYDDPLCGDEPPAADTFDGLIVACQRGGQARVWKGFVVFSGGGEGMVLYNAALADNETDNHWVPTVHLADGTEFLEYMAANDTVTGSFTAGVPTDGQGDVMAAFSSRGPAGLVIKPDITAPGVQILAGASPTPIAPDPNDGGSPPGEFFQAIAGTSMSSPHIAGSGILLAALHPEWTPGQIRSALMTTATQDVVKEDLTTPADPFDMGSGRVDLATADNPGLTLDETAENYFLLGGNPLTAIHLNIASINAPIMPGRVATTRTVTNVGGAPATYGVTTTAPLGTSITVSPTTALILPGASRTFDITIESTLDNDVQQFGEIRLAAAGRPTLHLPVAFIPTQGGVSLASDCDPGEIVVSSLANCEVTATNESFNDVTVDITTTVSDELDLVGTSTFNDVELAGREPGEPSLETFGPFGSGYLPLDLFGVEPIEIADEEAINFDVDPFLFNGATYDRIGIVANGYAVVGGVESSEEVLCCPPQELPNAGLPNNVLAPFWADLDTAGDVGPNAPGIFVAKLCDGPTCWLVTEWRVNAFGTDDLKIFQLWIGHNGLQDITFNYDAASLDGLFLTPGEGGLTIGAENENGSGGDQLDATINDNAAPTEDLLVVSTDPVAGDSVTLDVGVAGAQAGVGVVHSELTSDDVLGTTVDETTVEVTPLPPTDFESFVARLYQDFLGRDVEPAALTFWTGELASGDLSRLEVATFIAFSQEGAEFAVTGLYEQVLDRAPDPGGRTFWADQIQAGVLEASVAAQLAGSAEFFAQAGSTVPGFVDLAYTRLLGRAADAPGKAFWVAQITGGTSRTSAAFDIYQSAESRGNRVDDLYDRLLERAAEPAARTFWSGQLATRTDLSVGADIAASTEYFNL